jgi:hypothetical protein
LKNKNFYWSNGMNSLAIETQEPRAQAITINEDSLAEERDNFEIIGDGALIHWPDLDEDLSVSGILAGRRSGESQKTLRRWIEKREA